MEILRVIFELRDLSGEQVETAKVYIQGGISLSDIEALMLSDERLTGYTELYEHSLTFRKAPNQELLLAKELAQQLEFTVATLTERTSTLNTEKTMLIEEVTELSGRLNGLITPPVQGADWDNDKRYARGDTAIEGDISYTSLKFNRGKRPSLSPDYWKPAQPQTTVLVWTDIPIGSSIQEGNLVTYNSKIWNCTNPHIKSLIRQPSAFSDYWQEVVT